MLSQKGSDPDVIEAGFERLHKGFGLYSAIFEIAQGDPEKINSLLNLSVSEIYLNLQYRSHEAECKQNYQEIKKRNASRNNRHNKR